MFGKEVQDRVCRYYVGLFLLLYGSGKIAGGQFYRRGALPDEVAATTLGEAAAYPLAWTFMGYSGAYILFIGLSQIIGALLLLTERTKLLGVAVLIPILVNIVVFDIIFLDQPAALGNAVLYLVMLLYLLVLNQDKVTDAFRALTRLPGLKLLNWRQAIVTIVIMAVVFGGNMLLSNWLGYGNG